MPKREMTKEEFRKKYPHLSSEMEGGGTQGDPEADAIEGEEEESEEGKAEAVESHGYDPSVLDFLARCDTEKQAQEIIDYLEKRGEITSDQADSLRRRLKTKGVRSFGEKRNPGHYYKKFSK